MHDGIVRTLTDVRHIPELRKKFIFLGTLDSNGCSYRAAGGVMRIMKGALVVMKGHMSERGMDMLSKQGLLGSKKTEKLDFCEHCVFGKQCRVKFSRTVHTTKGTVDYIHSDLWGPFTISSNGGGRYMLTFIDDFSRKFCKNEGIMRHHTIRKTPQQNGIAERMNRILLERARCMLSNVGLSKEFWVEAVNTAAYMVNRSPSTVIDCKTPEEVWSGKHANFKNLRIFGCPAYAHVNDGKLEPRAKKCIFLGYANGVKGYRLWCPDSKSSRFLISRYVTFDESSMLPKKKELIDTGKDHGVKKKVELEVRAPDYLPIISTGENDGSYSTEENEESQEQ
ncbi:hypothetical protein RJ639_045907 [Escallonia herrerae]|uniref:Integrase catalytic domain-containing protein n=1 Tax=Escallonia herrerae TaxID=1293975 RepID=A0AA89AXS1_9ASTE|nr:hypothetical protein RJ639_045907 [Escallonia herrerae]